ncbi:MAG: hypothetical protein HQL90_15275 [Magnetococcales bacterium]|nr:hypothetical protein [Magnetococcales bacterium]
MMPTYAENKAAHEFYKAQAARLAFEKMRKNLVDRKTVDDEIFAQNRRVRDRLQNIPGRVAPIVAAITDTRQIEQVLSKEIYEGGTALQVGRKRVNRSVHIIPRTIDDGLLGCGQVGHCLSPSLGVGMPC